MYKRPMLYPMLPRRRKSNDNSFDKLVTLIALGVSIYIAVINRRNLEYNARDAIASERINEQLRIINSSNFMNRLNNEIICCEKERKQEYEN